MDINIFYLLEKDTQGLISCLCQLNFYEIQMRKVSRFRRPRTIPPCPYSGAHSERFVHFYRQKEFPVLLHQHETWLKSYPLEGYHVSGPSLYSAPLVPSMSSCRRHGSGLPGDAPPSGNGCLAGAPYRIPVVVGRIADPYDVVMDCMGALSHVPGRCKCVELN